MKSKILIADDHPILRKGLKQVIEADPEYRVVAEADNGAEALTLIRIHLPEVAVIDLEMPVMDGYELAMRVAQEYQEVKLLIITMHKDEYLFNKIMDIPAVKGYVLKESAVSDIVEAIRAVTRESYFISPGISDFLLRRSGLRKKAILPENPIQLLTSSEKRILKLIAENKTNREISEMLCISPKTVENHRNNMIRKLNLKGAHSLLHFAHENDSIL